MEVQKRVYQLIPRKLYPLNMQTCQTSFSCTYVYKKMKPSQTNRYLPDKLRNAYQNCYIIDYIIVTYKDRYMYDYL